MIGRWIAPQDANERKKKGPKRKRGQPLLCF